MFASILLFINISSCTVPNEDKTADSSAVSSNPQSSAQSVSVMVEQTQESASSSSASKSTAAPSATNNIIDNESLKVIPQQDNKIIITYPKNEINQSGDIQPNDQNYTLQLISGDYSDPKNAISTFLYDLYMKQSVCFDNIHRDIQIDSSNQAFVDTLYTLESMILNLGQVDVLVLPKLKYYSNGVPYIFQNAAAYKITEDQVIRFGNTCENPDFKQVTKGQFDTANSALYFDAVTTTPEQLNSTTYFEAVKTKHDEFVYRLFNIYHGDINSVTVSVSDIWMQAGFSKGKLTEGFVLTPLSKTPSLEATEKLYNLKTVSYLYANEDGAMIPSVGTETENK